MEMSRLTRDGTAEPVFSRETKSTGADVDREILIFPVELTTSRIGNLTRLIHTVAICVTIPTLILILDPNYLYVVFCQFVFHLRPMGLNVLLIGY